MEPVGAWRAYLAWLAEHLPQATALLNPPADESAIKDLEGLVGRRLPASVKAGWRLHDGQDCGSGIGAVFGFWWLPVAEVVHAWTEWAKLREDEDEEFFQQMNLDQRSYPRLAVRRRYTLPGWVPLFGWPFDADYVGLDYDPAPEGRPGQVINFGRDQEDKFVAAPDFEHLLEWLVQEATDGRAVVNGDTFTHVDGILVNALRRASGARFA